PGGIAEIPCFARASRAACASSTWARPYLGSTCRVVLTNASYTCWGLRSDAVTQMFAATPTAAAAAKLVPRLIVQRPEGSKDGYCVPGAETALPSLELKLVILPKRSVAETTRTVLDATNSAKGNFAARSFSAGITI